LTASFKPVEVIVVGAGLAGSTAAMRLAKEGREVLLLEKEQTPHHKVCGEFLSHESVAYIRGCGVEPLELGAASIRFLRLCFGSEVSTIALPFPALSLSRRVLDDALMKRAEAAGCAIRIGAFTEAVQGNDDSWHVHLRSGEVLSSKAVFLATGKHDLHGWNRVHRDPNDLVGFKLHWRLSPLQTEALREHIDLFVFPGGYGGISLVEQDVANLCLVVKSAELRRRRGWTGLFTSLLETNSHLKLRFRDAEQLWKRPLAISSIPYGFLADSPSPLWRLGDQAAVIPSLTGDGMAIALHSAALAAEMYLAGKSTSPLPTSFEKRASFRHVSCNIDVESHAVQLQPQLGFPLSPGLPECTELDCDIHAHSNSSPADCQGSGQQGVTGISHGNCHSADVSLVPQRFDRIEVRRANCRNHPADQARHHQNPGRHQHRGGEIADKYPRPRRWSAMAL
jgi:flavin-dependent dehydrogenase